jgi:peptidoglycan/LPS O-acetylase OafA/YrhL
MQESQGKFTRLFAVVAAFVLGGLCFSFIQKGYPGGGFIRDLLAVAAIALMGTVLSFGMKKGARRHYVRILCVTVVVLLLSLCYLKLSFKTVLEEAFSACVFSVNNLDGDHPVPDNERGSTYWKNY